MKKEITLGSLFDGIAGFPESARRHRIKSKWASEIEPFPTAVSKTHFPEMKHMGSITDIHLCTVFKYPEIVKQYMNNAQDEYLEPVDIITFGSPCQDLSVAGKRAGLGLVGGRSHLFFEAVRIIEQMQEETNGLYPKYAIWENVYGAFSSNGGRDFAAVLESLVGGSISLSKRQKWTNAGVAIGPKCQVAWRLFDAQYWGVPQRRRRIYLVADFTGQQRASEILFEPEGLPGDSSEGRKAREEVAACTGDGVEAAGGTEYLTGWDCQEKRIFTDRGVAPTISGSDGGGGRTGVGYVAQLIAFNGRQDPVSGPVTGALDTDGLTQCIAFTERGRDGGRNVEWQDEVMYCLTNPGDGGRAQSRMVAFGPGGQHEIAHAVRSQASKADKPDSTTYVAHAVDCRNLCENEELSGTLQCKQSGGCSLNYQNPVRIGYAVRRLTPLERERLQGLPDGWTNIPRASDTARYKAIGNGLAIPCPEWILGRTAEVIRKGVKSLTGSGQSPLNKNQGPSSVLPHGNTETW